MKTILVPTDFSENATNALNYAAAYTGQVRGKLIIVHIIDITAIAPTRNFSYLPTLELEESYNILLQKAADELMRDNDFLTEVETICKYGDFLTNMHELVKTEAVDLVIMGTKGASNLYEKLVGTNTSGFIKSAACPVLSIPSGIHFTKIKNIAYASDFEREETVYLKQLLSFIKPFNSTISIVNMVSETQLNIFSDKQVIQNIAKNLPEHIYSITQISENDITHGLQVFVEENNADILAIPVHTRNIFENLFHTSISEQLVYHPTRPLLTLPEKPQTKAKPKKKKLVVAK